MKTTQKLGRGILGTLGLNLLGIWARGGRGEGGEVEGGEGGEGRCHLNSSTPPLKGGEMGYTEDVIEKKNTSVDLKHRGDKHLTRSWTTPNNKARDGSKISKRSTFAARLSVESQDGPEPAHPPSHVLA